MAFQDPEELYQFVAKEPSDKMHEPDYKCSICTKRFPNRVAVRNHIESIHFPGMFEYFCNICGKKMASKSAINYHMSVSHPKKTKSSNPLI